MSFIQEKKHVSRAGVLKRSLAVLFVLFFASMAFAQNETTTTDNAKLLDDYIRSKGYSGVIEFDASNIKQFWVDPSVSGKNGSVNILLEKKNADKMESIPLKIQLANVTDALDCKVDVISSSSDIAFSVTNAKSKVLSKSSFENDFIHYHISSASFHLEDASGYSFNLVFESGSPEPLSIRKIVLSFSNNKNSSVFASPGSLKITENELTATDKTKMVKQAGGLAITGKQTILTTKFIPVSDNTISIALKIKNVGEKPARIYSGFATYVKEKAPADNKHYPYKNQNNVLNVVSAEKGSKTIVVDSYSEWQKNCYLALDAKKDSSDIPNRDLVGGRISEVRKLENRQAEIIMDTPLKETIKKGTAVRIQGTGGYLYTSIKTLQPGEEAEFATTIKKDENFFQYAQEALSHGIYYVKPLILTVDSASEILITDYSISF